MWSRERAAEGESGCSPLVNRASAPVGRLEGWACVRPTPPPTPPSVSGSGLSDSWRLRHLLSRVGPVSSVDERVLRGESDGIGVVWLRNESTIEGVVDSVHNSAVELDMCRQLNRVEWTKVGVGFAGVTSLMPMGHNKLAAVNREGWRKIFQWIEQSDDGEPIMEHAARQIVSPSS